ncbi:hypothetical protein ACFVUS_09740 [Nocardia sp. NPDC058058]|uniref:hypothetical protein n=1 Tax=Nocardia sp. NPDC058058 TaxID=3346317 RepID=UPI0036DB247F
MTRQASVVVYGVGDAGATGEFLGAATLIEPEFALVDPPLNRILGEEPRAVRVGIFAAAGDIAEVVDIVRVRVLPDAPDVVLLQLAVASVAPAVGVPVELHEDPEGIEPFVQPTRAEIIAAVRRVLAAAPPPAAPDMTPHVADDPIRWLLHLFGND